MKWRYCEHNPDIMISDNPVVPYKIESKQISAKTEFWVYYGLTHIGRYDRQTLAFDSAKEHMRLETMKVIEGEKNGLYV